jgi:hypothetical protein
MHLRKLTVNFFLFDWSLSVNLWNFRQVNYCFRTAKAFFIWDWCGSIFCSLKCVACCFKNHFVLKFDLHSEVATCIRGCSVYYKQLRPCVWFVHWLNYYLISVDWCLKLWIIDDCETSTDISGKDKDSFLPDFDIKLLIRNPQGLKLWGRFEFWGRLKFWGDNSPRDFLIIIDWLIAY